MKLETCHLAVMHLSMLSPREVNDGSLILRSVPRIAILIARDVPRAAILIVQRTFDLTLGGDFDHIFCPRGGDKSPKAPKCQNPYPMPKSTTTTTTTRTLSKSIIPRYCNNFAFIPSRSAWKVCINIPETKLV